MKNMKKVFNKNKKDIGYKIRVFRQGPNYVAAISNDLSDYVVEKQLHYSILTKKSVMEWAKDVAECKDHKVELYL